VIFEDVQRLYTGLQKGGRRDAVRAARAARRAAQAAARRPATE
jgi:hypothetical protein